MSEEAHQDRRTVAGPSITPGDVREAALTLFAERGYHGTSLKQVAAALRLRTPSLYNHMSSKSALLADIVMDTLHEVRSEFDEVLTTTTDPVEQLRRATFVYALHHAEHRREALVVNQDTQHLPEPLLGSAQEIRRGHERRFRQIITDGKTAGAFDVESPKLASFAIREMCVSVARWFRDGGPYSAEQVADHYADQALRLVGAHH